jgi:hypothetical protein
MDRGRRGGRGMKWLIILYMVPFSALGLMVTLDPYEGIDYSKINVYNLRDNDYNNGQNDCYCPEYNPFRF